MHDDYTDIKILVKSDQYWHSYRKIPNRSNSIFQEETFSFFEDSKNGPTIITLLPLNHHINFHNDSEYYLQVAVKFRQFNLLVNCHESL